VSLCKSNAQSILLTKKGLSQQAQDTQKGRKILEDTWHVFWWYIHNLLNIVERIAQKNILHAWCQSYLVFSCTYLTYSKRCLLGDIIALLSLLPAFTSKHRLWGIYPI